MSAQELFCLSRFNDLLLTEPTNEHDDDDHLGPRGLLPPSVPHFFSNLRSHPRTSLFLRKAELRGILK